MQRKYLGIIVIAAFLLLPSGCAGPSGTTHGEPVHPPGGDRPVTGSEPMTGRFKVYTLYRPQVQYRDFNGVFDIGPQGARIVRKFWKERFNELTRPGHYGEFFIEFYEYMSSLAQSYTAETREKERILDTLEKSFQAFCLAVKVSEAFVVFQKEQEKIYGD